MDRHGGDRAGRDPVPEAEWGATRSLASPAAAHATTESAEPRTELDALRAERDELWRCAIHLERLAQAGLLAGGMAHDMGNLLSCVSEGAELALMREDFESHRNALGRIRGLSRRAVDTLRTFVAFSRQSTMHREVVPVSEVADDANRFLTHTLRRSGVTFIRRYDDAEARALGSPTLLLQVMVNLVMNAARALESSGGTVEIRTRRVRDRIYIEVHDDGPGIPRSVRGRIFEPFVSANGPRRRRRSAPAQRHESPNAGLGLFVTRKIVEDMGGRISFETKKDWGTMFRVELAAAPE